MKEEYFKWYSPNLNKDMEMLVLSFWLSCLLFPTSMEVIMKIKTKTIESARWFIEQGLIQIILSF
jgi:esterase/lipase superfamily enzyme